MFFCLLYTSSWSPLHCLTANKLTRDLQASRNAAQDASLRENSWKFQRGTSICEECVQHFSSRTSKCLRTGNRTLVHGQHDGSRQGFASTGRKTNADGIFTEVSVISVSTKQMSLTLECGKPLPHKPVTNCPLRSLFHIFCHRLTARITIQQTFTTKHLYFGTFSFTCTADHAFILQSSWLEVSQVENVSDARVLSFKLQNQVAPLVRGHSLN